MPGNRFIFKGFFFHNMAPVAGGITDGQKDRFVLLAGKLKCFFRPGVPVDRVMGMLQKIGAFFID